MNLLVQPEMARVASYPHDGFWVLPQPRQQPAPNRVLVGEEAPGQRFVDDRNQRRICAILRGERSSGAQLHTHRLKIVGADVICFNNRLFSSLIQWTPFDLKKHADVRAAERKEARQDRKSTR